MEHSHPCGKNIYEHIHIGESTGYHIEQQLESLTAEQRQFVDELSSKIIDRLYPKLKPYFKESTEPITEAAKHPIRQRINQFKQKYHYREEEVEDPNTWDGPMVRTGVITINGHDIYLCNRAGDLQTLSQLLDANTRGSDCMLKDRNPPSMFLSSSTLQEIPKLRDAIILHEFRHFLQDSYWMHASDTAVNQVKQDGINLDGIHGKTEDDKMREIDADIYAARHSKDHGAKMKSLRKKYMAKGSRSGIRTTYDEIYPPIPHDERLKIQKMMDEAFEKTKDEYEEKSKLPDAPPKYAAALRSDMDVNNPIILDAAKEVMEKYNSIPEKDRKMEDGTVVELKYPKQVLWYTDKYRTLIYGRGRHYYSTNPVFGNKDFVGRLQALNIAKANGLKNPYQLTAKYPIDDDEIYESVEFLSEWVDSFVHSESFREAADTEDPIELKTPEDFLEWCRQNIDYGWIPDNSDEVQGTGDDDDEQEFFDHYRLQSVDELIASRVGVCWDTVRLEEAWLKAHNYHPTVYYMEITDGEACPTHTFTVFPNDGKFSLIDRVDGARWIIRQFQTMDQLYKDVELHFRKEKGDTEHPFFIKRLPPVEDGMTCSEYMDNARSGETVYGDEVDFTESAGFENILVKLPIYMIKAQAYSNDTASGVLYVLYSANQGMSRILVTEDGEGLYLLTQEEEGGEHFLEYLLRWCVTYTKLRRIMVKSEDEALCGLLEEIGFAPEEDPFVDQNGIDWIDYYADQEDVEPPEENTWKVPDGWLERNNYDPILGTISRNGNRFCINTQVSLSEAAKSNQEELVPIYGLCMSYSESDKYNDGTPKNEKDLGDLNVKHQVAGITFGDKYSHAAISFDDDLKRIWSYRQIGLAFESIDDPSYMGTDAIYLCVMFVKKSERDRMEQYIQYLVDNKEACKYAFTNLATQYIANPDKSDKRFICSTFSGLILSAGNPKNLHRDYSRLRPEDVTILPRAFYVMSCKDAAEFKKNHKEFLQRVRNIKRDHQAEINDYNNMLPRILLKQEMKSNPSKVTTLLDNIIKRFM